MMAVLLYRLGVGAYWLLIRMVAAFNPKAKLFVEGRKDIFNTIAGKLQGEQRRRVWVHCASLGEFEQGRPIIEAIRARHPEFAIVITFFSPSGYEVRKDYPGADYVCYLPIDSPTNAAKFLDLVRPSLCVFVKYELWYYYLTAISNRNIPCVLVSALFTQRHGFFKWYGGLQRHMLQCFNHIFVQDAESLKLLNAIGYQSVTLSGDTRFDRVHHLLIEPLDADIPDRFFEGSEIIVAGSTWEADEVFLQEAMGVLPQPWKLILVPHEVHQGHIDKIKQLFGNDMVTWANRAQYNKERVLVVDQVGMLSRLYQLGRVAWVGGGFGKAGVHNVLEPAVFGKPVFHGPIYHQFIEATGLIAAGGAAVCNTPADFRDAVLGLDEPKMSAGAAGFVMGRLGATEAVMKGLEGYLK